MNIFSSGKDRENVSVEFAIASGDEALLEYVYNRETEKLRHLDAAEDRTAYLGASLNVADIQSVRSKGMLVLLALGLYEVTGTSIEQSISQEVIEAYLWEVTQKIREVISLDGQPTVTQMVMAVLGIVVWWNELLKSLGLSMKDVYLAYHNGTLEDLVAGLDWSETRWDDSDDFLNRFSSDSEDLRVMLGTAYEESEESSLDILKTNLTNLLYLE